MLYYLQTRGNVNLSVYVYAILLLYGILAIAFFISQKKKDRKIDEYYDEIRSFSYEDLPEEFRRYVQYEHMLGEYENYRNSQ